MDLARSVMNTHIWFAAALALAAAVVAPARAVESNKWDPDVPISYFFDPELPSKTKQVIHAALDAWQGSTCLSFKEQGDTTPKVRFREGKGCLSDYGRNTEGKTVQQVTVGPTCSFFAPIAHEIGHVLGLNHTQTNGNRDEHISVNYDNMPQRLAKQFQKQSPEDGAKVGAPGSGDDYDYGSLMHFTAYNQQDGKMILKAKDPRYQHTMGNTYGPVFSDFQLVNRYYDCDKICARHPSAAKCQNGGFPNPKHCSRCVCPNGFGGRICEKRQNGEFGAPHNCGRTVQATEETQKLSDELAEPKYQQIRQAGCYFHIQAPPGQHVELQLTSTDGKCSPECLYGGVEIKFNDLRKAGAKFCCNSQLSHNYTFTTTGDLAIIGEYTQYGPRNFSILYHAVRDPDEEEPLTTTETVLADMNDYPMDDNVTAVPDNNSSMNTTEDPDDDTCRDFLSSCPERADDCETWSVYCPVTCGICDSIISRNGTDDENPVCRDTLPQCTSASHLCFVNPFGVVMRSSCPNTCGVCDTILNIKAMNETNEAEWNGCVDYSPHCGRLRAYCRHPKYSQMFELFCPLACGKCPLTKVLDPTWRGPQPPLCGDITSKCSQLVHLCYVKPFGGLVRPACAESCGICTNGPRIHQAMELNWDECLNYSPMCTMFGRMCPHGQYGKTFQLFCPLTCGLCRRDSDGEESPTCDDLDSDCSERIAECFRPQTHRMMARSCARTCGQCASNARILDSNSSQSSRLEANPINNFDNNNEEVTGSPLPFGNDGDFGDDFSPPENGEKPKCPPGEDDKRCPTWNEHGICKQTFTSEIKMKLCPRLCGVCA